jgi:hypothetical protein
VFALKKGPAGVKALMFDHPFMLYITKKGGTYPYLVIWVENAELLAEA